MAYALELAARLVSVPISTVAGAARRHPLAALGIGADIALVAYQAGWLRGGRLRAAGQEGLDGHCCVESIADGGRLIW